MRSSGEEDAGSLTQPVSLDCLYIAGSLAMRKVRNDRNERRPAILRRVYHSFSYRTVPDGMKVRHPFGKGINRNLSIELNLM